MCWLNYFSFGVNTSHIYLFTYTNLLKRKTVLGKPGPWAGLWDRWYRQISKPTFDLRQALGQLLRSNVPPTMVVWIFALRWLFKRAL